jgi:cytochrome c553
MTFTRILGIIGALLVTTAVAQPAATVTPTAEPAAAPVAALADNKPATFGDAKAGQTKAGTCAACHNADGNSTNAMYPKLAGQHERYIWRQLKMLKSGERENPIMMGMASALTEQDMRDIGAYFATQKMLPGVADDTIVASGPNQGKKSYQVGERIYRGGNAKAGVPACMACHGPSGRGNPGPAYPMIGGQHASYVAAKLQFFRGGGIWGKDGNSNVVMSGVAHNLSDEEIQSLSTYIEGLHDSADSAPASAK